MTVQDLPAATEQPEFTVFADVLPPDLFVRLCGELDFACADRLDRIAPENLSEVFRVDVDLSALLFSDLAGLRALLEFRRRHVTDGREVVLHSPRPAVRRVFELTGHRDALAA